MGPNVVPSMLSLPSQPLIQLSPAGAVAGAEGDGTAMLAPAASQPLEDLLGALGDAAAAGAMGGGGAGGPLLDPLGGGIVEPILPEPIPAILPEPSLPERSPPAPSLADGSADAARFAAFAPPARPLADAGLDSGIDSVRSLGEGSAADDFALADDASDGVVSRRDTELDDEPMDASPAAHSEPRAEPIDEMALSSGLLAEEAADEQMGVPTSTAASGGGGATESAAGASLIEF